MSVSLTDGPPNGAVRVAFIGTGGGIAAPGQRPWRNGPAVLLQAAELNLLIDTGRNALQGLHRRGSDPARLTYLAFTHLHSDHTVGLPDLVLATWVASGRARWTVLGPVGVGDLFERLFGPTGAFRQDIEARSLSPGTRRLFEQRLGSALEPPTFKVVEVAREGIVASASSWRLSASFAPDHVQPSLRSIAFRLDTSNASVVVTGDTGPSSAVAAFAQGADLLIHDCTLLDRSGPYAHAGVHTDPESLGRIAAEAGVRAVVGTHVTSGRDRDDLLGEFPGLVARAYHEPFRMAVDGLEVEVGSGSVRFLPPTRTQTARPPEPQTGRERT